MARSVMSIIWTLPSYESATITYVRFPLPNTSMSCEKTGLRAPLSHQRPPRRGRICRVGDVHDLRGVIIQGCHYGVRPVPDPEYCTCQLRAVRGCQKAFANSWLSPDSTSTSPGSSKTAETGAGRAGSVTSMIWTPLSLLAATMAYVRFPLPNTSTSSARSRRQTLPNHQRPPRRGPAGRVCDVHDLDPAIATGCDYGIRPVPAPEHLHIFRPVQGVKPSRTIKDRRDGAGRPGR